MTWASDTSGKTFMGVWGQGALKDHSELNDLLQGATLLNKGARPQHLPPPLNSPALALGRARDGDLLFAMSAQGDTLALTRALELAGAHQALLLTGESTAEVGRLQTFYEHQGRTFYALPPQRALRPALLGDPKSVLLSPSEALILTQRPAAHRARFVYSFKELKTQQEGAEPASP
jgi:hypothetical protein